MLQQAALSAYTIMNMTQLLHEARVLTGPGPAATVPPSVHAPDTAASPAAGTSSYTMHVLHCSSHTNDQTPRSDSRRTQLHVAGLGDPVMDILVDVDPQLLSTVADKAGGCIPINTAEMSRLLAITTSSSTPLALPGGSAANVLKGLANLSAGQLECSFMGMVGRDATAAEYTSKLQQQGVTPRLVACTTGGAPTASCLCLITPDGQRTMRTCLGAAAHLTSAALLPLGWPTGLSLLHCEGYCLYKPQLAREAMAAAKKAGALVSLDLASFELVTNCRGVLQELLAAGLVDLVFANEEEACALAADGAPDAAAAGGHMDQGSWEAREQLVEAAQQQLLRHARVAVVSLGARGCVARSSSGQVGRASGKKLQVVDTVGAGDTFTAGFLYGYLHGCSLEACAALGCSCGSEAVVTRGATLSPASWSKLQQQAQEVCQAAAAAAAAAATADASSSSPNQQRQQQRQQKEEEAGGALHSSQHQMDVVLVA